ncbi:eukaryotic translation initiation factor 2-alpha kinase-like [Quercus lobata]|uniref:eukaryotic translation initiation factor 2-alpha kinase-like n=1 Tax=Quercus lobata TaxID=97700 RepID=UPI001247CB13|nr:eukaryotic translation initiation factor 2-alpha kinase-like [Quercus lobata]
MAQIRSDHGNFFSAATEYEILRGIAEGSSGQVFLCKNMLDQHEYALKKIFIEEDDDDEKILEEARIMASLDHPHVIRYYQVWRGDNSYNFEKFAGEFDSSSDDSSGKRDPSRSCIYILMEYCPKTLETVFREGISEELAMRYFRQIVEGLDYIHSQGLIHRDICSQNLFLDSEKQMKIGDFGLAKFMEVKDGEFGLQSSDDYGHHFYRSPEATKNSWITQKSDIYSLGVLLFGLLYPSKTEVMRIEKLNELQKSLDFPDDWKYPDLIPLIRVLMSKDPSVRPSTADILAREQLWAIVDDVQVQQLKEENLQLKEQLQQVDMGMDMTRTHLTKRPHTF